MATQKIHFFTGKGGVGKSLLAAAFANTFSKNRPILLAELNERSFYKDFLQLSQVSYKPTTVEKLSNNLFLSQWSPADCLKEYALHLLKVQALYRLFFENPVSRSLINVAPGLQELAILGKATSGIRKHGPAFDFSEIVIDSFSTGHFLNLLRAPKAMAEVISFGPMGEQSRSIHKTLKNPEFTEVHIVTLPEELPVTEALELANTLKAEFGIKPKIYLNKIFPITEVDLELMTDLEKELFLEIIKNQNLALKKFVELELDIITVDFIPELDAYKLIQNISVQIQKSKAAGLL